MPATPDNDAPTVSDSELEVLKELWDHGETTPSDLHQALLGRHGDWAYTTVQTFLHRLHDKRYVARRREGRTWVYAPLLSRDEVLRLHVERELRRVGGSPSSTLVLGLLGGGSLKRRDIARLRRLLDRAEADLDAGRPGQGGRES